MRKLQLAAVTLFLLLVLLCLHLYAMKEYLYLALPFLDIFVHFLGGVCLALSAFYVLKNPKYIIAITIFLGIVWEVFEVYFDIIGWPVSTRAYKIDTTIDIIMDTLGAVIVWLSIKWRIKYKKQNELISNIS